MNFTSSDEPTPGFMSLSLAIYLGLNVLILYSFLKLVSFGFSAVLSGFVVSQISTVSILYVLKSNLQSLTNTISTIWGLSTRSQSSSFEAVQRWVAHSRKTGPTKPEVLGLSIDRVSEEVEIEVLSSHGFGFLYGDVLDVAAKPEEAKFARKDSNATKFTTCYFCNNKNSDYKTGVFYQSGSNCSHQHAVCEDCIRSILGQVKPELKELTTTEDLVANNI